jgi:cell division transport system permease protein
MARRRKIKKQPSAIPSIVSMALVMFLLIILALVVFNANSLSKTLKESINFRVFLMEDATTEDAIKLQMSLEGQEIFKDINFISKEEAAEEMKKDRGHDFVETLGFNPLAHSLEIILKSEFANEETLTNTIKTLEKNPKVFEVSYQKGILDNLNKNLRIIGLILLGLCVVFSIIAAGLINGTIRLNLFSRRFIIKSMQLVGATEWFITKPLIGKFVRYAITASIIAAGLVALSLWALVQIFPDLLIFNNPPLFVFIFCVTLLFGIVVVAMSTYSATKKYLKINLDELY